MFMRGCMKRVRKEGNMKEGTKEGIQEGMTKGCTRPAHDVNTLPEPFVFFHSFPKPRHQSGGCGGGGGGDVVGGGGTDTKKQGVC